MLARLLITLAILPLTLAAQQDRLDLHHLPLGDHKVTDHPQSGYVFSCQQHFNPNGPGAQVVGPWIHIDQQHGSTWDLAQKIHVQGEVHWPNAQFKIETTTDGRIISRLITGNGLPVDSPTGTFPVQHSDPAFQIDHNPNSIEQQKVSLKLPLEPTAAEQPSCVSMGMIGVALNGVAIYNAFDEGGRDAVAHEVQDLCNGHPQRSGEYHYHGPSPCLPHAADNEVLVGYALDGFGIYSFRDASGVELTNADLDACHGRTTVVDFNGKRQSIYHYVLTREYPYTIACFRGTPLQLPHPHHPGGAGFGPPHDRGGFGPPPQ